MSEDFEPRILPYQVWVEYDESFDDERTFDFATFEEAENFFHQRRSEFQCKVIFRETNYSERTPKVFATYYGS